MAQSRARNTGKTTVFIVLSLAWVVLVFFVASPYMRDVPLSSNSFENFAMDDDNSQRKEDTSSVITDNGSDNFGNDNRVGEVRMEEESIQVETPAEVGSIQVETQGEISQEVDYTSKEYMKNRSKNFYSWFEGINKTDKLLPNADENGTIMDFAIVGFPKCGTTTVEANLGYLAPIPITDVCAPPHQTVYYSYMNWPKDHGEEKILRGTKCPAFIQGTWLTKWSEHLPRTKLIVGVRHPILWFQSFWNMQAGNHLTIFAEGDPYKITKPCMDAKGDGCRNGCPARQLLCMHRGRFHLALASLGKTTLSDEERQLLAPDNVDGGMNLQNHKIKNPIFVYEQKTLGEDYVWEEMANYLGVDSIPHDKRENSHGRNRGLEINFCDDKYDDFRAMMMPISYNVSVWLQDYLVPAGKDESSKDVVIARPDTFSKLVEEYKVDPCGKLVRLDNGTYVLLNKNAMIV